MGTELLIDFTNITSLLMFQHSDVCTSTVSNTDVIDTLVVVLISGDIIKQKQNLVE